MTKMSFYIELNSSIKWTVHPRRMKNLVHKMDGSSKKDGKINQVHKVDGSSKKDGKSIKSIKWTVHPRRMEKIYQVQKSGRIIQ